MQEEIDAALAKSANFARWLQENNPAHIDNADERAVLSAAFSALTLEHHLGMLVLFNKRLPSPAFALVRCAFDAYWRGEWAGKVASDDELSRFMKDEYDPKPDETIKRLCREHPEIGGPLADLKRSSWKELSGFTHSGFAQMSNWVGDGVIGPTHSPEATVRAIEFMNHLAILAALSLAEIAGKDADPIFAKANEIFPDLEE